MKTIYVYDDEERYYGYTLRGGVYSFKTSEKYANKKEAREGIKRAWGCYPKEIWEE